MRGSTLERNRITALHVGSVSINLLLYTDIQKTITVSRSSSDLSGLIHVITKCDTIMHQAIEYNLDKSVISDITNKHYLKFSQWMKFIFKTSRFNWDSDQLKDGVPPQRTMSEGFILVYHVASWHKRHYGAFLWVSYYIQLSYNAYESLVVCLLFHEGKQRFLQTVLVQEDEEETVTLLRETEIYFYFVLHCVRPLQNRPTKKLQNKHIPKTGSKDSPTQPSQAGKTDNTLIVWISSSQHDNS